MAPKKNQSRQKPGTLRSRQQTKLNSQRAQRAPISPVTRTGPRRQLPPSSEGQRRVGNSSQPFGEGQRSGNEIRKVNVRVEGRPQLPGTSPTPEKVTPQRALPASGESSANKPSGVKNPSSSRQEPTRRETAQAKLNRAAQGSSPSGVRIAKGTPIDRLTPDGMFAGQRVGSRVNKGLAIANLAMMTKDMAEKGVNPKFWEQKSKEIKQRYSPNNKQVPGTKSVGNINPKEGTGKGSPTDKKPAGVVPAAQQRTTVVRSPAPKAAPKPEPKAEAQSYRDERDTKGLSVGRYYTLAEHRAAVQAGKSLKIGSKFDTKSDLGVNPKSSNKELDTSKVTDKSNEYDKKKRKKLN